MTDDPRLTPIAMTLPSTVPFVGPEALLGLLVRLFVSQGDAVVTSAGAYPTFNYHVTGFGGVIHTVPYAGDHEDPARLIATARDVGAKLIYIANPDNPMGTYHKAPVIERMIEDVINAFHKVRNHFGMNRTSQIGAIAALQDDAHLSDVIARVQKSRDRIAAIAYENGLVTVPSVTSFVAIDCGQDGAFAKRVVQELGKRGVFVRMPFLSRRLAGMYARPLRFGSCRA